MTLIDPSTIVEFFHEKDVSLCTGVPDSLLSSLTQSFETSFTPEGHIIAANEGNAVALAMGHYMAGQGPAVVYLQNSGLGNIVNPVMSLAHEEVYSVPMFLIVGWRGEPGVNDEPQHVKQGRSTTELLDLMDVPWRHLSPEVDPTSVLEDAWEEMTRTQAPVALLIGKNTLGSSDASYPQRKSDSVFQRESAIELILDLINEEDLVVATTGKTGREVYESRIRRKEKPADFLTVGGMGHALSIALGVARGKSERRVICLDGDGAVLMHMGGVAIVGAEKPRNLVHVVLNNQAHESVGGQPTVAGEIDLEAIALGCGYQSYHYADDQQKLTDVWRDLETQSGPILLEIGIALGSRPDLGRPKSSPQENKVSFMKKVEGS